MSFTTEKKSKPILCVVESDRMNKSRVGTLERLVKHERYGKYIKRRTRIMFHDEKNESRAGDKVLIIPSRPHSARKKFDLVSIVEKSKE